MVLEWMTKPERELYEMIKKRHQQEWEQEMGLEIATLVMKRIGSGKLSKGEMVKEFIEEMTEYSEEDKNYITIKELTEKYEEWHRGKYNENREEGYESYITDTGDFGKYLTNLANIYKETRSVNGKTTRVCKNIVWKGTEAYKVKEWIRKYTNKTNNSEDRISINKLVLLYNSGGDVECESGRSMKETNESFKTRAKSHGYRVKTCYEKPIKTKDKTKEDVTVPCLMEVKATEQLKELIESECKYIK
jgi:hypothetical protein